MDRLRRKYNDRENEWGEKLHTEMRRRGELLEALNAKLEGLFKERDTVYEYAETWKRRAEAAEKEGESLRASLGEAAKKAEEKGGENKREMGLSEQNSYK